MSTNNNVLLVGNYNREDYIDLFNSCRKDIYIYFLDFASPREVFSDHYKKYGEAIFWSDFKSAKDLLKKIKPRKIIFFYIESYYHILLNLACKELGVHTNLIDHGIRDLNINLKLEQHLNNQIPPPRLFQINTFSKLLQLKARVKTRLFLQQSVKELNEENRLFFREFYKIRSKKNLIHTFKECKSALRTADAYIAFSPKTYEVHQHYDHLPKNKPVHFIGIPTYDHLAELKVAETTRKQIIFLDQGLVIRGYFGWTVDNYRNFVITFAKLCHKLGYELLVKLHPVQLQEDEKLWSSIYNARLINNNELANELPFTKLIIGFFSTYLLPLAAMQHTTLLTLENHPAGRLDVSKSFIDAGVAHPIYDLEELNTILPNIEQLHQQQLPNKAKFTEEWMYKFDGKAGERLRDILLSDDL